MTAVHTNKAPGGVAYACSFRIAEAVYLVERMVDILADELGMDPVALRLANFIQPDQFPYVSRTGWVYDSGNYPLAMAEALRICRVRRAPGRAGRAPLARRADGDRRRVLHRGGRRRPAQGHGPGRARHVRRLRADDQPHRHRGRPHLRADPGPGPRDDVRADRRRGDRHPSRRHRRDPRRHRQHAVRTGDLRQPLDAGLRRGGRARRPQAARPLPRDRRPPARGLAGRPGLGARHVLGARRAR